MIKKTKSRQAEYKQYVKDFINNGTLVHVEPNNPLSYEEWMWMKKMGWDFIDKLNDDSTYDKKEKKEVSEIEAIEKLLDLSDDKIKSLYDTWDKGDCSLIGITEIYLYQNIKRHKEENVDYYNTDYDSIILRYGQKWPKRETVKEFAKRVGFSMKQEEGETEAQFWAKYIYFSSVHISQQGMNWRRQVVTIKKIIEAMVDKGKVDISNQKIEEK